MFIPRYWHSYNAFVVTSSPSCIFSPSYFFFLLPTIKEIQGKANDCISCALRLPFGALIKKCCQLVTWFHTKFAWRPLKRHCPKARRQRSCSETIPFVHEWAYCSFFGKLTKILVADVYIFFWAVWKYSVRLHPKQANLSAS